MQIPHLNPLFISKPWNTLKQLHYDMYKLRQGAHMVPANGAAMKKRGSRTILDTDSAGLDDGGELSISRAPPLPRQKSPITQFLEPMFPCQVSALPCSGIMIKCCWCSSKSPRESSGSW